MQPLHKKKTKPAHKKSCNLTWVSEWVRSCNLSTQKIVQPLHTKVMQPSSSHKKLCKLLTKTIPQLQQKIMQPLDKKITQPLDKKSRNYTTTKKITQPLQKKSCNLHKNKSCSLGEWMSEKNYATSPHTKVTLHLHAKNHATSEQKKSRNLSKMVLVLLSTVVTTFFLNKKIPPDKKKLNITIRFSCPEQL